MAEKKKRTSGLLVAASMLICIASGAVVTQSSAVPSPLTDHNRPDMIVAEALEDQPISNALANELETRNPDAVQKEAAEEKQDTAGSSAPSEEEGTSLPEETAPPSGSPSEEAEPAEPTESPAEADAEPEDQAEGPAEVSSAPDPAYQPSAEAGKGTWIYADSTWYYHIGEDNHRGWLYDSDHHIYFFDRTSGGMLTGWQDIDGKRYYFDADGIMQTGRVRVDGQVYQLLPDGSLKGYNAPVEETAAQEAPAEAAETTE